MKQFDATITITFQARVQGEDENYVRDFAWEKLMGESYAICARERGGS